MPQNVKPYQQILDFQKLEEQTFWALHPNLFEEMRKSWAAIGKPFPDVKNRNFLEIFYGGENGYYGNQFPAVISGERIYFPEINYRDLLKFLIDKHNIVVQSVRDDALSTKLYLSWLKNNSPFSEISDILKYSAYIIGIFLLYKLLS